MRVAKFNLGEFKLGDRTETFYVYTFPTLPNYLTSDKRPVHPGTQPRPPLYYRVKDIVAIFLTKYPEYINHCIPVLQGFDPFYTIERQGGELFIMVSALQSIAYKFPDQPHLGSFCNFHLEEFQRGQANNVLLSLGFTRIARPVTQVDDDIPVTLTEKQRSYQPPASATGPSTAYSRSSPTSNAVNMARGTTTPATTGYPEQTRSPHYGHLPRPATGGPHPNHLSREVNHTHEGIIHKPAYPSPYPAGRPRSQHDTREYDPHRHPYHSPYDGHEIGNGPAPKRQRSNPRPDSGYPALPSPMNPYGPSSHVQGRSGPPPTMSPTHARDAAAAASRNALNLTVYTAYDDQPAARPTDAPYSAQQPAPRSAVPVHHKPYPPPPTSHAGYPLPSPRPTVQASAAAPPMPHHLAQRGPASSPLRPGPPAGALPRSRLNSDGASTHRSPPDHNVQLPPLQAASSTTPATASPADRALSETLEAVRSQMERLIQLEQRLGQQLHQSTKILNELERQTPGGPAFWMRMRSLVRDVVAGNEDATTTAEVIPALATDPLALLADNACADPPAATVESPASVSMTMSPFSPATKSVAVSGSSGTNSGSPTAGASTVSSNVTDSLPSPAHDTDPSSSISSTLASTELRSSLPPAELPPSALAAPVVPTSAPVLQNS